MKPVKYLLSTIITIALFSFTTFRGEDKGQKKEGYEIKVHITGLKDTFCLLANYYGDKQYIQDTGRVNSTGDMIFKGDKTLGGGIYLIVLPSKNYFETVITDNQFFSLSTDTSDLVKNMKVKGSEENTIFYEYQNFIASKHKEVQPLREQLKKVENNKDSSLIIQEKIKSIDNSVKEYQKDFIKKHANSFVSKTFVAMQEIEIPETSTLPDGSKDSTFPYRFYKQHYFDNIDFSDDRLLRTPIFHKKISYYMEKMILQHPDSIILAADYLVEKARANKEVFKYVVYYITYTYETSKIMGMDAVFVHMGKKYYASGEAYWVDSTQLSKIVKRVNKLEPILIGKKTPNLIMPDTSMRKMYSLHDIKAKYTVVIFYDHDCGHCKKEIPKFAELYKKYQSKGMEVYAVEITNNMDAWKKFIVEHKLNWINVADLYGQNDFREKFDIYSTPVVYLLDENKIIKAKRIGAEQVEEFMERFLKNNNDDKK